MRIQLQDLVLNTLEVLENSVGRPFKFAAVSKWWQEVGGHLLDNWHSNDGPNCYGLLKLLIPSQDFGDNAQSSFGIKEKGLASPVSKC
jgi:hypothetical protein